MMTTIEQAIDKSRAARFSGLRSAGDISWALKDRKLWGQALRYESLLNQLIPGKTVTTVCHYNASLCSPMEAAGLMNVHTSHFHLSN